MLKAILLFTLVSLPPFLHASQTIEIGNKHLEYEISGSGDLHVLFDAGALTGMAGWDTVWDDLPSNITAFRFSRLGEGNSDVCSGQRTDAEHVKEVEAVVNALGIKKPFLYVGHSLGGATARNYASRSPENLLGMLLVDPENPRDVDIIREIDPLNGPKEIEAIKANDYKLSQGRWCFLDAVWKKHRAKDFDDIGDMPVTLIATTMRFKEPKTIFQSDKGRQRWGEIQRDWVNGFPQGKFVATDKSGHFIQQSEPDLVLKELALLINRIESQPEATGIAGKWQHIDKPAVIEFNMQIGEASVFAHKLSDSAELNLIKNIVKSQLDDNRWQGKMYDGYQDKYVDVSIILVSKNLLSIVTGDQREVLRMIRY